MWINPGTAWWRADFVTYNSNTGLFCFVKITFELMNTGEVKIGFRADTLKGRLYSSGMDLIVLFFEIVAVLLCLTFFARMWFQLLRQHRESKVCVQTRMLHKTPHFPLYIQINIQIQIQHNPLIFRCTYKSLYKYKHKYNHLCSVKLHISRVFSRGSTTWTIAWSLFRGSCFGQYLPYELVSSFTQSAGTQLTCFTGVQKYKY